MKRFFFALLCVIGATRFAAWWHRRRVIFVCYHGVTKRTRRDLGDPTGLHVNHRRFAAHLDFLSKHYHFISLEEYVLARRQGHQLPNYSVLLTFDDGFRNFLTVAAPLLSERQIPATVFLITGNADARSDDRQDADWSSADDIQSLSWSEAKLLKERDGFDFGSHTCSHSPLLSLSRPEIERELRESREDLRINLGLECPALSYPKGERSQMLAQQARRQGYGCAVTTDRGANEMDHDLFTLGRTLVGDDDDVMSLAVRVSGLRRWLISLRAVFVQKPAAVSSDADPAQLQTEPLQLVD
jgi:peptidoglycan/xylan/chitin deacetylase (PgdA/CDA1 family)